MAKSGNKDIELDLPPEKELSHPLAPWREGSYEHFDGKDFPDLTEEPLPVQKLKAEFSRDVLQFIGYRGDACVLVKPERIVDILQFLRDEEALRMDLLRDLFGVDNLRTEDRKAQWSNLGVADARFEVIYHLYSLRYRYDLRIRAALPAEKPTIDTSIGVFKCANWFEREAWDMFGIQFLGHPNLRRILNHEAFEGHPLRKDYPVNRRHNFTKPVDL